MKKFGVLVFCLLFSGCTWFMGGPSKKIVGSGNPSKKEVPIADVRELDVSGIGTVLLSQGDNEFLVIEADDNVVQYIITKVDNNTLYIRIDEDVQITPKSEIVYHLSLKSIDAIELHGAVNLKASEINTDELALDLSGASRIDAIIKANDLEIAASGATKCYLQGNVERQKIIISGSAFYNAGSLISKDCDVSISGSVRVMLHVLNTLTGNASGVAFIGYRGDPTVNIETSGAVKIQKVG